MLKEHTSDYPGTFAVVTSAAVRGTTISPAVVDVRCSLYPKTHPFGMTISPPCICINTRTRYFSFLHIDDLCHTLPFALKRVLSIAVIEGSTNPSATNRYPIVDILSFISVDMVFNLLSNVRLLLGIVIRPQANASLRLY